MSFTGYYSPSKVLKWLSRNKLSLCGNSESSFPPMCRGGSWCWSHSMRYRVSFFFLDLLSTSRYSMRGECVDNMDVASFLLTPPLVDTVGDLGHVSDHQMASPILILLQYCWRSRTTSWDQVVFPIIIRPTPSQCLSVELDSLCHQHQCFNFDRRLKTGHQAPHPVQRTATDNAVQNWSGKSKDGMLVVMDGERLSWLFLLGIGIQEKVIVESLFTLSIFLPSTGFSKPACAPGAVASFYTCVCVWERERERERVDI